MNVKQLIAAAVVFSVASTVFAEQGDGPSPSAIARAEAKAPQRHADTKNIAVNGKTRAEVRADAKNAPLFSNRDLH
jgi:hypothetical protein